MFRSESKRRQTTEAGGRNLARRYAARAGASLLTAPLLLWASFHAAVAWWPYPAALDRAPQSAFLLADRNGVPLAAFASDDGQWRMLLADEDINPHLLQAILAVEDARFYEHRGVDWKSVAAAGWQDLMHLGGRRGASTLTMQLQRLLEPRPRTLLNKIEQAVRAEQLERRAGKRELLVEYVNRAPFGGNLVGAGAASWRYFGKPCRELSLGEAALLAGLPQSPNRLRPDRFPARAWARRDHVLDRMLECGFITARERDEAAAEPIRAAWRPLPQDRPPGDLPAADGALPTLLSLARGRSGGLVETSLDAAVQRQCALAACEHLRSLSASGISAAAVVVLDTQTAECLACVSLGDRRDAIDLTRRRRSSGSVLKPFIYAAAFDAGIYGPGSILSDSPSAWPGYQPSDYDRAFRGNVSAAEALAESRNIPAMLVLAKVGIEPAVGVMDAAGLHGLSKDPQRYGLALAIGGAEASPMEIAEAYAALARGGLVKPVSLHRTPDADANGRRCLRAASCGQALNALADVARTSEISPEASRSHVAWKTGTSSGHRDAWCAAVTHRRTVVVWLGNTGGQGSPGLVGRDAAAPLALQLVAMLDPSDEPWPLVPDAMPGSVAAARDATANPLVMVRPANGEQFVLTSDAPQGRQRVLLEATHRGGECVVWWFVDGRPIGSCRDAQRLWWDPTAGAHDIRALDSSGHSASAHVQVRLSAP